LHSGDCGPQAIDQRKNAGDVPDGASPALLHTGLLTRAGLFNHPTNLHLDLLFDLDRNANVEILSFLLWNHFAHTHFSNLLFGLANRHFILVRLLSRNLTADLHSLSARFAAAQIYGVGKFFPTGNQFTNLTNTGPFHWPADRDTVRIFFATRHQLTHLDCASLFYGPTNRDVVCKFFLPRHNTTNRLLNFFFDDVGTPPLASSLTAWIARVGHRFTNPFPAIHTDLLLHDVLNSFVNASHPSPLLLVRNHLTVFLHNVASDAIVHTAHTFSLFLMRH
jgi:hypothetical protein